MNKKNAKRIDEVLNPHYIGTNKTGFKPVSELKCCDICKAYKKRSFYIHKCTTYVQILRKHVINRESVLGVKKSVI